MKNKIEDKTIKNEISELISDYLKNGKENFVPYENGNNELKKWVDSLDELKIPNEETLKAIEDGRAGKNLSKISLEELMN